MSDQTAAHFRALELYKSQNPRALHLFLERWKRGVEKVNVEFALSVVSAYQRIVDNNHKPDVAIGELTLCPDQQRASWQGRDIGLTVTEFRIVSLLTAKLHSFVSYRQIYDTVHYAGFSAGAGTAGYHTNVRSIIKRMRRKFEGIDPSFDQIHNYPGFGYRWAQPHIAAPPVVPLIITPGGTPIVSDHDIASEALV